MLFVKYAVPCVALLLGAWFIADGARALIRGDYVTPRTGPHAGQLGPWSKLVGAVGLEPRSTFVKSVHVALGLIWLVSAVLFFARPGAGWYAVFASSVLSLWYLPLGTVLSVIEVVLLLLPVTRTLN